MTNEVKWSDRHQGELDRKSYSSHGCHTHSSVRSVAACCLVRRYWRAVILRISWGSRTSGSVCVFIRVRLRSCIVYTMYVRVCTAICMRVWAFCFVSYSFHHHHSFIYILHVSLQWIVYFFHVISLSACVYVHRYVRGIVYVCILVWRVL